MIWAVILGVSLIIEVIVCSVVLPSVYLKLTYTVADSDDRCIKRVYEKNGQTLVFEPVIKWRKYLKQYIISERYGKKVFIAKLAKDVSYIELDIAVFNNNNLLSTVVKLKDYVKDSIYTAEIELPEETSYVAVNILKADNETFEDHLTAKVTRNRLVKYILLNAICTILACIIIKVCLANLFGGLFRESYILSLNAILINSAILAGIILINVVITAISLKIREKNFVAKGKGYAK